MKTWSDTKKVPLAPQALWRPEGTASPGSGLRAQGATSTGHSWGVTFGVLPQQLGGCMGDRNSPDKNAATAPTSPKMMDAHRITYSEKGGLIPLKPPIKGTGVSIYLKIWVGGDLL